jgi:hypothetical protein
VNGIIERSLRDSAASFDLPVDHRAAPLHELAQAVRDLLATVDPFSRSRIRLDAWLASYEVYTRLGGSS